MTEALVLYVDGLGVFYPNYLPRHPAAHLGYLKFINRLRLGAYSVLTPVVY